MHVCALNFTFSPNGTLPQRFAPRPIPAQIVSGRVAMLAVAYFALAEKLGDSAIINAVPFLPKTGNVLEEVVEEIVESLLL